MPDKVKVEIAVNYLFKDMITTFRRFFDYTQSDKQQNISLLFQITQGFLPRRFQDNIYDHIIYDEDQEVDEMYFI